MNSLITKTPLATKLWFTNDKFHLLLEVGREIAVPLEWFSSLLKATDAERNNWRLIGGGGGIHWKDLDEYILVENLL